MPEVIDLISSPVGNPRKTWPPTVGQQQAKSPASDIFNINSEDFNFTSFSDDFDVSCVRQKKKRRPSPPNTKLRELESSRRLPFLSSDTADDVFAICDSKASETIPATITTPIEELRSDPIIFLSSAPEPRTVRRISTSVSNIVEADDSEDEDVFSLSQTSAPTRTYLSERTVNLLAKIAATAQNDNKYRCAGHSFRSRRPSASAPLKVTKEKIVEDGIFTSSPPKPKVKFSKAPVKDQCAKGTQRAATRAKKDEGKQAERERKRISKEEKAREKQLAADIAEVNKSKIDKKNSTPEMIVDMSRSLEGTCVGIQVVEYMKVLGVETAFFDGDLNSNESAETVNKRANLVRWRRKIKAKYNEDAGHWEPIPVEKIEVEKHILLYMTAQDFLEIAASGLPLNVEPAARRKAMVENLDAHVATLRRQHKECKPIYLIEGLSTFLRKNKNAKNRAYTAAVRSQIAVDSNQGIPPPSTSNQPRRKRKNTDRSHQPPATPTIDLSFIDEDITESLLLHLQLHHTPILIHQSATPCLSAEWVKSFTEHISTIPYRHVRLSLNDAVGFCMDVGQVKTGDDRLDTYVRMLQEVQRVTPAMAYGIANHYDSLGKLIRAFRQDGPLLLQDIRKSTNRDGAVSDRALGPAVSRRLYKVCTGRDPASMDGIS